jgi:hypothetical protein
MNPTPPTPLLDARGNPYFPAVAPALRKLLVGIFAAVAVLSANGAYLAAVTLLEFQSGQGYQNQFYFWMVLLHVGIGILLIAPFVVFGVLHMRTALKRTNRRAVHAGIALFSMGCIVILTGCALIKRDIGEPWNSCFYWAHVLSPIAAVGLYVAHRLAGPAIEWKYAGCVGGVRRRFRRRHGGPSLPGSAHVESDRPSRGREIFPAVAGTHRERQFHPAGSSPDG